jgi:hypothetical protein
MKKPICETTYLSSLAHSEKLLMEANYQIDDYLVDA